MQEITAPLATLPDDAVPVAADVEFPVVLRGYERDAVDAYVQRTSQLVAELQATRSPEAAIRRALERVGEEVSGILQRAHDTASNITAQSRSEAEDRLEAARQEATQIVQRAEDRVRELDAETDRIWAERHRIVEDTRELARELLTLTDSAADRFPPDAAVAEGEPAPASLPDEDVRAERAPVQVPVEDALPDRVAGDESERDLIDEQGPDLIHDQGPDLIHEQGPDLFDQEGPDRIEERDPHVEPTAILPVVEPDEDAPEGS